MKTREAIRQWKIRRRAQGMCSNCWKQPPSGGFKMCDNCRKQHREYQQGYIASQKRLWSLQDRQAAMRHRREVQNAWRQKKKAEGYCGKCFKVPAGGEGGTAKLCPPCAQEYRSRNPEIRKGGRRKTLEETRAAVDLLIRREELRSKMNPMRVTFGDIRRQAVC